MYESIACHPYESNLFWFAVLHPYGRKQSFLIYDVFLLYFIFPFSCFWKKEFFSVSGGWERWIHVLELMGHMKNTLAAAAVAFLYQGKRVDCSCANTTQKRECSFRKPRSSFVVQMQWEVDIRGHGHKHGLGVPATSEIAWTSREGVYKLQILAYLPSP